MGHQRQRHLSGLTLTEAAKRIVPEEMMTMLPMFNALKCALQRQDLTGTAVFLASEDSDMMTGQVLVVDGGMIMLGRDAGSAADRLYTGQVVTSRELAEVSAASMRWRLRGAVGRGW